MDVDLSPKLPTSVYDGDGGSYLLWSPEDVPMLKQANIGAAKLCLNKNGLAMPHYADSHKVGYVLEGCGVAGIVQPGSQEEKVIPIKKGDAIALPFGVVSWWYNKDDAQFVVLFLGTTDVALTPGIYTYFFLTGSDGIFKGFTTEFVSRAWNLEDAAVKALVGNQANNLIVKLDAGFKMPEPKAEHRDGMVFNLIESPLDVDVKHGGTMVVLNARKLPLLGEIGFAGDLVSMQGKVMYSPGFSCDSALQVTYIISGSGTVQIVGAQGKRVLQARVEAGNLIIVPRFFVVSKIADNDGMECFSIVTTPNPMFTQLAGTSSVYKALSPEVLQGSFKVSPDLVEQFRSKMRAEEIFFPPN